MKATRLAAAALVSLLLPHATSAQSVSETALNQPNPSSETRSSGTSDTPAKTNHWGVTAGFATWNTPNSFDVIFDAGRIRGLKGRDIEVGAVHGSTLGGHVRLLFVRKRFDKNGTLVRNIGGICFAGSCVETGGYYSLDTRGLMASRRTNSSRSTRLLGAFRLA